MARLNRGDNPKIDKINDLVATFKCDDNPDDMRNKAITELYEMFRPLILRLCKKWSDYFDDVNHKIKSWDDLVSDAEYWFIKYTKEKYIIDGDATYNKFIKDHLDQRIRYIYECELKYYSTTIFPDPNRYQEDGDESFDTVAYNYSSTISSEVSMEENVVDNIDTEIRSKLAIRIMDLVESSNCFNEREKKIFREVMCNGVTQDEMSKILGISRTRVVQILRKIKYKLKSEMENDDEFWNLILQTDIIFDKNYL
jgi:RNA polymerase sigma factor (sigma-70 family)